MIEYLHKSVPVTMLADLKDSVRNNRDVNLMDKYGATAVSLCTMYLHVSIYSFGVIEHLHVHVHCTCMLLED